MDSLDPPRGAEPGASLRTRGDGLVSLLRRLARAPSARTPSARDAPAAREAPAAGGCLRCGACCEGFGAHLRVSKADLERWKHLGREDLLRRVGPRSGWIWLDPDTGTLEERCPFLRAVGPDTRVCGIHGVKPDMCRDYPTLAHGRRCLRGVFLGFLLAPSLPALLEAAALGRVPGA